MAAKGHCHFRIKGLDINDSSSLFGKLKENVLKMGSFDVSNPHGA